MYMYIITLRLNFKFNTLQKWKRNTKIIDHRGQITYREDRKKVKRLKKL